MKAEPSGLPRERTFCVALSQPNYPHRIFEPLYDVSQVQRPTTSAGARTKPDGSYAA
jgi:hypothetical protein